MYNKNYNDILYIIQNGSLLRIDESYESYDVFNHYCLEFDEDEDAITAIVCEFDDILFHVDPAQALIFATCMIISVPVRYINWIKLIALLSSKTTEVLSLCSPSSLVPSQNTN